MELHLERVLKVEAGCWLNQEDAQRTIGQRGRQELPLAHQALPQSIKVLTAFAGVAGRFDGKLSHRSGRSGDALCGDPSKAMARERRLCGGNRTQHQIGIRAATAAKQPSWPPNRASL